MKFKKTGISWDPQKQKEIIGKLLNIQEEGGKYATKVYYLETEYAIVSVFGSTVLDARIQPIAQVGNVIKVVFLGKKESKDGQEYKDFDCYLGVRE